MRTFCINFEYPPVGGGGAPAGQTLSPSLARNGHEIDTVPSWMNSLPLPDSDGRTRTFRVPSVLRNRFFSTPPEPAKQILPSCINALVLARVRRDNYSHTELMVRFSIVAKLVKKAIGLPYLTTAHGLDIPSCNADRCFGKVRSRRSGPTKKDLRRS